MSLEANALDKLRLPGTNVYAAGYPGYLKNFNRDSFIHADLDDNHHAAVAQINFAVRYIGRKKDPHSGEEEGKWHHEIDPLTGQGVEMYGKMTTYNACDTTALGLLAMAKLGGNGLPEIITEHRRPAELGLGYIASHRGKDGIWYEDPALAGADRFALRVTTWKDSVVNGHNENPPYPRAYALAHFINTAAVRAFGRVLDCRELSENADEMEAAGIKKFWTGDHFITAIDGLGEVIDPPSSDSLHILDFIERDSPSLPEGAAEAIEEYMRQLETPAGYRAGLPTNGISDSYHMKVWVHEQAILRRAAMKHRLRRAAEEPLKVLKYVGRDPDQSCHELVDPDTLQPTGNVYQLFAYASIKNLAAHPVAMAA